MKLFEQIAQSIVEQTSFVLEVPMSITDEKGIIIGCTDLKRIGTYHEATKEVFRIGKAVQYSEDNVIGRENVLPGVATPIFFQQEPIGVLGIVGDPKEVIKYVYLVRNHVEMLLHETLKAESFSLQMKAKENFIQYLLHQRPNESSEELINYCEMMGFNVKIPRVCILIHIPHYEIESISNKRVFKILQYDLFQLIGKLFKEQDDDLLTSINIKQWIVLKGVKDRNSGRITETSKQALKIMNQFLHQHQIHSKALIAVGNCYEGVEGISRSYHQALKLLSISNQSPYKDHVYSYQDWNVLIISLIEEINPTISEVMLDKITNLINHPSSGILIETFLIYCQEGLNMSKAARSLYIHRNTLLYRLNQINELLQMNVNSFEESMALYLALKGYQMNKEQNSRFKDVLFLDN
ncbi:CdaR family transcriptional regulator [Heyndrickxia sp. NPDC080065]|uniref:CdaR family transcriptional regulator n=1 Tax=Heyndrickxia sp. NPDC080065 TaxID=3390568 RepID=UPI003CFE20E0